MQHQVLSANQKHLPHLVHSAPRACCCGGAVPEYMSHSSGFWKRTRRMPTLPRNGAGAAALSLNQVCLRMPHRKILQC